MYNQKVVDAEVLMPLRSHLGRDLFWSQPQSFRPWWELRAGHTLVATLEGSGWLWGRVDLRFADQVWELRRKGLFLMRVDALHPGDAFPALNLRLNMFWQARFQPLMGDRVIWRPAHFLGCRWCFLDEGGRSLIEFVGGRGEFRLGDVFRHQARVYIDPKAYDRTDLALLVGLGWTLFLFYRFHR